MLEFYYFKSYISRPDPILQARTAKLRFAHSRPDPIVPEEGELIDARY